MTDKEPYFRRILLKVSGEALMGDEDFGIDPLVLKRLATELKAVKDLGVQIGVVVGGGNIFRGHGLAQAGMDRVTGDHMGMLATVINSLALQEALERIDVMARVMSGLEINAVCEVYIRRRAVRHLEKGRITIFAAGLGNPFFTTDTSASLRAIEIGADILVKATKVDGVYDSDPKLNPNAERFSHLNFDKVIDDRLNVMDTTAVVMCRDNKLPIRVFDIHVPGNLMRLISGESIGTLVDGK
ncbi:MAG: UMP kinase [Pseudomonadota bacterium]|nr:UMP kinase [Pseudomonadota bacterium]